MQIIKYSMNKKELKIAGPKLNFVKIIKYSMT